jgi:hypothetical protein
VSFDQLANLRTLTRKSFFEGWAGVIINEKPNQGAREGKNVGIHGSRLGSTPALSSKRSIPHRS